MLGWMQGIITQIGEKREETRMDEVLQGLIRRELPRAFSEFSEAMIVNSQGIAFAQADDKDTLQAFYIFEAMSIGKFSESIKAITDRYYSHLSTMYPGILRRVAPTEETP